MSPWTGTSAEHCQKMVDKATSRHPMVKFMLEKMDEVGAGSGEKRVVGWVMPQCAHHVSMLICHALLSYPAGVKAQ